MDIIALFLQNYALGETIYILSRILNKPDQQCLCLQAAQQACSHELCVQFIPNKCRLIMLKPTNGIHW